MYCTAEDMIKRFEHDEIVKLTDKDGTAGEIVVPVLEQAISDATATVNGYLSGLSACRC